MTNKKLYFFNEILLYGRLRSLRERIWNKITGKKIEKQNGSSNMADRNYNFFNEILL